MLTHLTYLTHLTLLAVLTESPITDWKFLHPISSQVQPSPAKSTKKFISAFAHVTHATV